MFRVTPGSLSTGAKRSLHFQGFLVIGTSPRYILFPVCSMAVDYPLVLYDCHFEGLSWRREEDEVNHVLSALQQQWTQCAVRSHVLQGMIQGLEAIGGLFDGTKRYLKGLLPPEIEISPICYSPL